MISGPFLHFDPTVTLQTVMMGHPNSPLSIPCTSTSPNVLSASDIRCRVCDRRYDGSQHFGIDICRACAAFFRRSVAVKKTFVCRRGYNTCALNTVSRKTTCQKCRWMRCLQVGLQFSVVAGHRSPDHVKPQSRDEEDLKNIALVDSVKREGEESDTGSEGKSPQPVHTPPLVENLTINPSIHVVRPIPTIGNPNLVTTRATLINKVLINYNEFTKNRLEVELSLPHVQQDSKMFGPTGIPIVKASRETVFEIYQKQVELLHIFLKNTFDEYALCDEQEQKRICALFYPVLWEIESCYWTYRNMPVNADCEHLLMCTQTTYIDVRDVEYWLGNVEGQNKEEFETIKLRLKHLLQTARTSILERMHKIIIKEFEVITLLALNIWAPRNHSSSESKDCAEQVRTSLFNDLHYLYHDGLKIDNYAGRIGEVMCLYTDVQNADLSSTIKNIFFADLTEYIYSK
ncbi:CRE-NHR-43 protein [Caenorhabditis remanei]|uniref:CRE-NHR-43 protein n=1 Tax=Caenorhabditis remanei TaxID=31234 RepID=E3MSS8_CAERE|nr:CRE-NHR-43 protein [Caenorhabditis remanei]